MGCEEWDWGIGMGLGEWEWEWEQALLTRTNRIYRIFKQGEGFGGFFILGGIWRIWGAFMGI